MYITCFNRVQNFRVRQRAHILAIERKRESRKKPPSHKINFTDINQFTTPVKYQPQIRQHAFDYKKTLPQSPTMKVALMGRMIGQLLRDPTTHKSMTGCLRRITEKKCTKMNENEEESCNKLQLAVLRICGYRAVKHFEKLHDAVQKLKSNYTIRSAAKKLNISYSKLHGMLAFTSKSTRAITDNEKHRVSEHYRSNSVTLQLPYKQFAKNHYLRSTLEVAFHTYVQECSIEVRV